MCRYDIDNICARDSVSTVMTQDEGTVFFLLHSYCCNGLHRGVWFLNAAEVP